MLAGSSVIPSAVVTSAASGSTSPSSTSCTDTGNLSGSCAQGERQTTLRVEVDEQHPLALLDHRRTQTTRPSSSWRPHPFDWPPPVPGVTPTILAVLRDRARLPRPAWSSGRIGGRERRQRIGWSCFDTAKPNGLETGKHTSRTELDLTAYGPRAGRTRRARHSTTLSLDNPLVVSSPRKRALATAELAGLTVDEVSPLLVEWDYGDYEGLTTHEIRTETAWLAAVDLRLPRRGDRRSGQHARRPGRSPSRWITWSIARRGVRRARPLLPRGGDPLGRAAAARGLPVRVRRRVGRRCAASSTGCASSSGLGMTTHREPVTGT